MSDLHDARVEAAAKAMYGRDFDRSKESYPDRPNFWAKDRPAYAEHAALALVAADAVVTVEMIADAVRGFFEPFIESNGTHAWVAMQTDVGIVDDISASVLALLRGGEER